jgi:uncharacterized membrane protein YgcG
MGERTKLRGGLAVRRGLVAASAAVVVLLPLGSPAAARPAVAWTKTWAEHQLRVYFDATTVACLPLGSATRTSGGSSFKDFVCGLVLTDGTRVTIHLKPKTRTTWTTVSMKRLPPTPVQQKDGGGNGSGGNGNGGANASGGGSPPGQDNTHGQGKGKNG